MSETVEQAAARLGITPAELERRIDEQRAAIRGKVAALDLPPGYEPGSHKLRLPDGHALAMGEGATWRKLGPGQPSIASPLELALEKAEAERLKLVGANRRKPAAAKASGKAAETRSAKAEDTRKKVERLTKQGKLPHVIALDVGITARHVRRIQAAAKQTDITAAGK